MLTELAVAAGFLGQTRACSLAISTLCRNTVPLWDYQLQHQHQQQKKQRSQNPEDLARSVSDLVILIKVPLIITSSDPSFPIWTDRSIDTIIQFFIKKSFFYLFFTNYLYPLNLFSYILFLFDGTTEYYTLLISIRLQAPWLRSHWSASVRVLQLIHLLADFISDWDLVVHALEQLSCVIASTGSSLIPSTVSHEYPSVANGLSSNLRQLSASRLEWASTASVSANEGQLSDTEKLFFSIFIIDIPSLLFSLLQTHYQSLSCLSLVNSMSMSILLPLILLFT